MTHIEQTLKEAIESKDPLDRIRWARSGGLEIPATAKMLGLALAHDVEGMIKHKEMLTQLMRWIADASTDGEDETGSYRRHFVGQCYDLHRSGLIDMNEIFPSDLKAIEAARAS